jgi:hypothetical protein
MIPKRLTSLRQKSQSTLMTMKTMTPLKCLKMANMAAVLFTVALVKNVFQTSMRIRFLKTYWKTVLIWLLRVSKRNTALTFFSMSPRMKASLHTPSSKSCHQTSLIWNKLASKSTCQKLKSSSFLSIETPCQERLSVFWAAPIKTVAKFSGNGTISMIT